MIFESLHDDAVLWSILTTTYLISAGKQIEPHPSFWKRKAQKRYLLGCTDFPNVLQNWCLADRLITEQPSQD